MVRYGIVNAVKCTEESLRHVSPGDSVIVRSGRAELRIDGADGRFSLCGVDGKERLRTCEPPWGGVSSGFGVRFALTADEALYGLGNIAPERLQRRGLRVAMWAERQLFASAPIPFLMSGRGWAIFMNTIRRHTFDIGHTADDRLRIEGESGELDFFLFAGGGFDELLDAYTDVAGKPPLLPIWMYGLNFCSRNGSDAREVLDDAIKFRRAGTPCDLIGLTSDWMETVNDYSTAKRWHPERFPTSRDDLLRKVTFIGILQKQGFKLSLSLGCDYDLTLLEERLASGEASEADEAERKGSEMERTGDGEAEPWYDHLRKFVDDGISAFVQLVVNPAFLHPGRIWGNGMSSEELHNVYPVLLGKQMHLGFREQTNRRPAIHMEKGYAGMQRFVASTTGTFYNAKLAIAAILNYGMSGHAHTTTNMHLITREGIHADFLLAWARVNSQDHFQHPDFLEPRLHELFQTYARLRYRLLPYLYSTARVAARTGMPITRAMPLMYPDDPNCRELCQQYMLGDVLLVVAHTDRVYLPEGEWIDYWTGERWSGPQSFVCNVPARAGGPLFVRAGAIVPLWPPMDFIGQTQAETLTLDIYPGRSGEFVLYEDDGVTFQYEEGQAAFTRMECESNRERTLVRIARREGAYAGMPLKRTYELVVHANDKPAAVRVNGQRLADRTRRVKADPLRGWRYDRLTGEVRLHVEEAAAGEGTVLVELVHPARPEARAAGSRAALRPVMRPGGDEAAAGVDAALDAALDAGDPAAAEAALAAWWAERVGRGTDTPSPGVWPLHVMSACHLLIRHAERRCWAVETVFGGPADTLAAISGLPSPERGYELLQRLVGRLASYAQARRPASRHPLVRELTALLEREFGFGVSLDAMAERFAVHPFHLSRLFKKETGQTFSDYLTGVRMRHAKKQLEAGCKVYEAAASSGYKDAGNFSKAFSKYWGAPPVSFKPGDEG